MSRPARRADDIAGLVATLRAPAPDTDPDPDPAPDPAPDTDPDPVPAPDPAPGVGARPAGRSGGRSAGRPASFAVSRTSVAIPATTADRLRSHTSDTGQSVEEVIVLALLDHYEAVAERWSGDRLVQLGLRPRLAGPSGQRQTVSLRLPIPAREELDKAAGELGLNRSALVAALLDAALAG